MSQSAAGPGRPGQAPPPPPARDLDRAEALARTITDLGRQAEELTRLATAVAQAVKGAPKGASEAISSGPWTAASAGIEPALIARMTRTERSSVAPTVTA